MVNLLDVPDLPLLHILLYLDYESLISLSAVCHRLRNFVDLDKAWFKHVVKHEDSVSLSNSCAFKPCCKVQQCYDLPLRRKYFITRRISCKDCGRRRVMKQLRRKTSGNSPQSGSDGDPRLSKCGSKVWISYENELKKLQFADVHDCGAPMSETSYAGSQSEILRIAHWNDFVTACCLNGQLLVWNSEKHEAPIDCQQVSSEPLISCDFDEEMIAVGSGDKKLTVYRMDDDSKARRVWSANTVLDPRIVALRPCDAVKLFVSSYRFVGEPDGGDVSIYDVQTGALDQILDINTEIGEVWHAAHWETFSTLIIVGWHNLVRICDMRTNSCVYKYHDSRPGLSLNAVRGDGSNAVVIGGDEQDLISVLDRRHRIKPVRSWTKSDGGWVNDIAVDMTHICFTVWDSINAIDFNY